MPRLKDRWNFPPGGFQAIQPELGQTVPFNGSFQYCCEQIRQLREANPFLCQRHGLSTDMAAIEAFVEEQNAMRCLSIAGGEQWVIRDAPGAPMGVYNPGEVKKKWPAVVGGVKRVAAGIALLTEWLGSGAKPVEAVLAEKRAAVCADCPKNDGGDWKAYFTEPIAEKIRVQLEIKNDLQLSTPLDNALTVCSGCDCPLKLKVWAPLDHVLKHTSEETKTRLDPRCWILSEK